MNKLLVVMGTCLLPILEPVWATGLNNEAGAGAETPWCAINPANPRQGTSLKLGDDKVHIVAASKQADAKTQLSEAPFKEISRQDALMLLHDKETVDATSRLYLVRASAFNIDFDYKFYSPALFKVVLFPEHNALKVINFSLASGSARPINFAIVVETDIELKEVDVTCLSAM